MAVAEIPKSAKLVKLVVDFGDHERTILAGLKQERADPQEIVGRQALFVVNLAPKRMAGEVSQGMLFDIGSAYAVTPVLAVPERAVPNGVRAGQGRRITVPSNKGMKLTKPGRLRSFAAYPRCSADLKGGAGVAD